jgi:protein subunit release factor B
MSTHDLDSLRKEVQFQTLRGTGPGGQHRNKVETAVRATHIPTGITVLATEHRSQYRNKTLALERLRSRLIIRNKKRKPRINTRPKRSSIEKRLEKKRRHAQKKRWRQRIQKSMD